MGVVKEFLEFIKKYQVLGLAIAFIIGSASTKLVTAVVNDLIMPIVGLIIPGGDWRSTVFEIGHAKLLVGDFAGVLLDFIIIALVVFVTVKWIIKEEDKKDDKKKKS